MQWEVLTSGAFSVRVFTLVARQTFTPGHMAGSSADCIHSAVFKATSILTAALMTDLIVSAFLMPGALWHNLD